MTVEFRLLTAAAAVAALALAGCNEEKSGAYSRIPEVAAPAATAGGASVIQMNGAGNPHGADPHAGMSSPAASGTTASASGAMGGLGAGFEPPPPVDVRQGGNILEAAGIAFTVPEDWKQEKPTNAMRLAQYTIPGEAGPADLVVFYFGKGQGGTIEANVRRWTGQFTSDDPSTTSLGADVAEIERDGLRIALVKTSGTYDAGSMGPMTAAAAAGPKPNQALFGLVIEGGPQGSLFVKVTGPKATIDAQSAKLEAFAQSVRPSSFK